MTFRQMEYFIAIVEEGSFSRAARRLNVTQPALSQQITALELELGAPLIERLGRGARPTAAGRAYLPHVLAAMAAHRRGTWAVHDVKAGLAGEVELATVISVGVGVLLKPLLQWRLVLPNVAVRLSEFSHRRLLEEFVAGGGADLAIGPTPLSWDGSAIPLGDERFVLMLPNDDPAAAAVVPYPHGAPRAASRSTGTLPLLALRNRRWVLFERSNGLSEFIEGYLVRVGLPPPRASVRTTQFMAAATLASGGMGPTLIPANVVPADLAGVVCEPDPPLRRSLSAYCRGALDGFAKQFIDLIGEHSTMLELTDA